MKRTVRFLVVTLVLLFTAAAAYPACYYPKASHVDYYQHHYSCTWDASVGHWACIDYWSLDGTCDYDCDGNAYCEGDTEMRSDTLTQITLTRCDPVCE